MRICAVSAVMNGEMLAIYIYKDEQGALHAVSPVCTHMRYIVRWNGVEKSWDCPCHGSRFGVEVACSRARPCET